MKQARIQDVAAAAGVSVATVSNVLNRPTRVRADTAERVRKVILDLDYVPHAGAAGLRNGRPSSISLVLPDLSNAFYARIAQGAAEVAYEHGFSLSLCLSGDDPDREAGYFSMLVREHSAGAVVVPVSADPERLSRLRERGIPLVLADRSMQAAMGCSVAVDDVAGGRLAAGHLIDGGAKKVLVVNGDRGIRQCADRFQGARLAARGKRDVQIREVVVDSHTIEAGRQAAMELDLDDLPDGVFCVNDPVAVGFCRGLSSRGLSVPGDVSVVGFGDLDVASTAPVALTTVAQPVEALGRAAVDLLLDEVESPAEHVHTGRVFAPELVVRDSSVGGGH